MCFVSLSKELLSQLSPFFFVNFNKGWFGWTILWACDTIKSFCELWNLPRLCLNPTRSLMHSNTAQLTLLWVNGKCEFVEAPFYARVFSRSLWKINLSCFCSVKFNWKQPRNSRCLSVDMERLTERITVGKLRRNVHSLTKNTVNS